MTDLSDSVSIELDRRKLQKLVDDGVITWEQIASAEIIDEPGEIENG